MSTATERRRVQFMNAEQLREQQETSGREGLASLLKAVRRMLDWLLLPFRMVGRVLFKPRLAAADNASEVTSAAADQVAALQKASPGDISSSSQAADAVRDQEYAGLLKQVAGKPDGGLDIEVEGKPEDLEVVLPMLMRHVDQILKTHLPSDAQEAQVASHLLSLAETAECSRYAHRLVSWEVDSAMKTVLADSKYVGLSNSTVEKLIRVAAKSPDTAAEFGDGSAEQRLLARLAVRDKIEADYVMQMRQIAVALVPMLGSAKSSGELAGRGKDLLDSALQAADGTRQKLRVRHAAHGKVKVLPETLPAVQDALDQAIASVAGSIAEKDVPSAAGAVPAGTAEVLVGDTAGAPEMVGLSKAESAAPIQAGEESGVPAAAAAPAEPARQAPPVVKVAETVKTAPVAVQAVRSGGMFGGVVTVQRSAAELEEENVVDDAFSIEDGENLVAG